ncbi:hypothetical protein [Noviherbaspirillum aridicola]|uniref:Lipoprotein n=1 Tax=Noviherbaspirillum aridicola TaxID=2849687 RepID=A0ABQ4Q578_9BURK|nr:hypothetical protein [Noviherbaspirillum aridicola]GIZ52351.1 hypothetical protein NCCP691_23650 [Noviherbaspirillum aridicola]
MTVTFRLHASSAAIFILSTIMSALGCTGASAAEDKGRLDERVVGHYVHLVSKQERETSPYGMRDLIDQHRTCVRNNKADGKPYLLEPTGGWPATRSRAEREIYYSRTRTIAFNRVYRYRVKRSNCDLEERSYEKIVLRSAAGSCLARTTEKTAYGQCDVAAHRRMVAPPPNARYPGFRKAGVRDIAGYPCNVYLGTPPIEICIAQPKSDFPIMDAFHDGHLPGLQLQWKDAVHDFKADVVRMNIEFPESVFSIPEGLRQIPMPPVEDDHEDRERKK